MAQKQNKKYHSLDIIRFYTSQGDNDGKRENSIFLKPKNMHKLNIVAKPNGDKWLK